MFRSTRTAQLFMGLTLAVAVTTLPNAPSASAESATLTVADAIAGLPVADEVRTGYDRDLFKLWVDADGDGCNARYEVLIEEADDPPTVGSRCRLTGGRWFSYYDRESWTNPADLDIDHVVALAEAWDSGASQWSSDRRREYANDLDDYRTLIAVTDDVNQAKGDKDPTDWLPEYDQCRYLNEWVAVKVRWQLTIDPAELDSLNSLAATCPNEEITVEIATVP
jgi:Protein of unknown function (DUF1524)